MNSRCYRCRWRMLEVKLALFPPGVGSGLLQALGYRLCGTCSRTMDGLQPIFADLLRPYAEALNA